MAISKARIKYVHALEQKKIRNAEGVFVAEGPKVVGDLLVAFRPVLIIATSEWFARNGRLDCECVVVTDEELRRTSLLQHPQEVIAVFEKPSEALVPIEEGQLVLALDGVQDPGNLGTIVRIADWFGFTDIYCSKSTADGFSPKVVQAAMGSTARVRLHYTDLNALLAGLPEGFPVYGTLLDGRSIYTEPLEQQGVIIMGNEGNGISAEVRRHVNHPLLIPNYPLGRPTADSLNVAVATAITCAEFRRRL